MALTTTTLSGAFDVTSLAFNATAATGATVGGFAKVNDEYSVITEIAGTRITVRSRGDYGTIARSHVALSPVTFGVASDLPNAAPGTAVFTASYPVTITVSADGNLDFTTLTSDTTVIIAKATAAALTLLAPTKAQDGLQVTLISSTAAAHAITYTAGFAGNTTSSDIATFAATINGTLVIVARNGTWAVVSTSGVTVA